MDLRIINYNPSFENQWLRCFRDSYYESSYFDSLVPFKPRYEGYSIELIALLDTDLVGFLDIEVVSVEEQFCSNADLKCAQISLIGVRPDKRRMKIGSKLIALALQRIKNETEVDVLEIIFREDNIVSKWLISLGFEKCSSYYELSFTNDFLSKYDITLPFGLVLGSMNVFADKEAYEQLVIEHAPEYTYPISVFIKTLI